MIVKKNYYFAAYLFIGLIGLPFESVGAGHLPVAPESVIANVLQHIDKPALQVPDGRELSLSGRFLTLIDPAHRVAPFRFNLPEQRIGASAVVLPDGRVLIWGGTDSHGQLVPQGVWFNYETGTFSPATKTGLVPIAGQTMAVLEDGRILLAGGVTRHGRASASIWNPVTGGLEPVATSDGVTRYWTSATLNDDGSISFRGGVDDNGHSVDEDMDFDPMAGALAPSRQASATADRLAVIASIPTARSVDNRANTPISVHLNRPVDPRTVTSSSISLIGPAGPVDATVTATQQGRLLFVVPSRDLLTGSYYTLVLSKIRGADGQQLPFTSIGFRTATLNSQNDEAADSSKALAGDTSKATVFTSSKSSAPITMAAETAMAGTSGAAAAPYTLIRSTGGDPNHIRRCHDRNLFPRPCREKGFIEDGAWYPGQDNVGTPGNGHWRLNAADEGPEHVVKRILAHREMVRRAAKGRGLKMQSATALAGHVSRIDGHPVRHVRIAIGKNSTYTDAHGDFTLRGVPSGHQQLYVDGTSANGNGIEYGTFLMGVDLVGGETTIVPHRMYLPRILGRDKIELSSPTTQDMTVTHPDIPGLEIHIPEGTVIRDHEGRVATEFAIVPIPVDRAPYPVPVNFPVYFSLQPGGATVQGLDPRKPQGITLTYPNYGHTPAGTPAKFIAYEPDRGWRTYGAGAITSDGTQLKPENGVHLDLLTSASWGMDDDHPGDPNGPNGDGPCCGDPVDLFTGNLVETQVDATINDIIPIQLARVWHGVNTYAINAPIYNGSTRLFGGWRSDYNMYAYSATGNWEDPNKGVRLPSGRLLAPFTPISKESGSDGTWRYDGTEPSFKGAILNAPLGSEVCHSVTYYECYSLTLRDGTQYWMDIHAGLYKINDRFGNSVDLTREAGLLTQVTSPSGRYFSFQYDSNNNVTEVRDNSGRIWTYSYHAKSFATGAYPLDGTQASSSSGSGTTTTYFLDKVTYPDATFRTFTYDEDFSGAGTSPGFGEEVGPDTCPHAHVPGTLLSMADRNGIAAMTNAYCGTRVVKQTYADGSAYMFEYSLGDGQVVDRTDVTDPLGHVRRVTFDVSTGLPSADIRAYGTPLAQTTTYERDAHGLVDSMTDPLGRTTTFAYDADGNVARITRLAGTSNAVTEFFSWTSDGQLASRTDALAHKTTYGYVSGCLSRITDPLGHVTSITCNVNGQPLAVKNALGNTTILGYEGYDLHSVTDALDRTYGFGVDGLGRLTSVLDPLGNRVLRTYDSNDRLVSVTNPKGGVTGLEYDHEGHLTHVAPPQSGTVDTVYDNRYRLASRTDALGHGETWTYDALGNVATHTDRKGQTTTFDPRDALGRFTKVSYADGSTITADTYDAGNRLRKFTDSIGGTILHNYDDLDRLIGESTPQGAVTYTYASNNLRTSMTPDSQAPVTYAYDDANRLVSLNQGGESVGFTYDSANRRTSLTLPNGIAATYDYDAADQLSGIVYAAANTTVGEVAYTYDASGHRIGQTGSLAHDLLPSATTASGSFDPANRQTSFNGNALTYDANGNLTSDGANTYTWNARNQLVQIQQNGTTVASFEYDATGRRAAKTINGMTTNYLYDGVNAVQETQGTVVNPILTGLAVDERFARNEGSTRSYFLSDALGSTVALADIAGSLIQQYQYDPYGNTAATPSTTNPYQYTGRENDDTGLYYYRARYYSPIMGRFISEDPIGFGGKQNNFYAYAGGNPVNRADPTGLIAYIARNGNNIVINIPIAFSGGNTATYNAMARAITSNWTGQFGQYSVITNVIDGSNLKGFETNYVKVLPGDGMAQADQTGGLSYTVNNRFGNWYEKASRANCLDYAHEGGHLMGLGEMNDLPNLMNQYMTTPEVTPFMIEQILSNPTNVIF